VTLNIQPGSPDSAFINGLYISKADITLGVKQVGTREGAIGSEGMVTSIGSRGRGGQTITDDAVTFEFNIWSSTSGGA
jgi:hypothetical protein